MTTANSGHPFARALRAIAFAGTLAVIVIVAWRVYQPGLSGDFLFDDFANLPALGATGPVDNAATLARYLTSGGNDPVGRPLTLASFLMDARDWPANPYSFKLTNVLLHLLNGVLLACVLLRLGYALQLAETQAKVAALFGAGVWLLHPLLVSTTLYIVQREAMLPATFALIGMLGWMSARAALMRGHTARGLIGMAAATGGCTLLALLSKGNGALLPLLLLLAEWIVLAPNRPMPTPALERRRQGASWLLLILPSIALAIYLCAQIPASMKTAARVRDWTLGQRLLSEPRALTEYLGLLWWPRAHSTGLFTDAFALSISLLQPWTTLPCLLLVLALIGAGFALRKKHPAIALALLFYFAGQLLESTWIPLELYYEHRNYLPSLMIFWPLGIWLGAPGALRLLRQACAIGVLILLGSLTFQRASLWGDSYRQAQIWAVFNPDSARAQANAAQYDLAHDRPRVAAARLRNALPNHPDDLQISLNLIGAECRLYALRPQTLQIVDHSLTQNRIGGELLFNWFGTAIDMAAQKDCRGLDFQTLQTMIDAMRRNPHWRIQPGRQQDIAHLQGELDLAERKPQAALADFDRALSLDPKPDAALEQAAALGAHGDPALGLAHLEYWRMLPAPGKPAFGMPRIHAWVLTQQHYWQHETEHLRATLITDAAAQSIKTSSRAKE